MSQWLVEKGSALLGGRTSRRNFLVRSAVVGSALAVSPARYLLRPGTAYAAICSCANANCDCAAACCDGYTDFCCSVNNGQNSCPPGTFEAGWWRADGSSFCNNGPRYYVDCNVACGNNSYSCKCGQGNCNNRRTACNQFRYGNCHREIECFGPIACRVVSCTPPYQLYSTCDNTTLYDNSTANHTANCAAPPPATTRTGNLIVSQLSGKVLDVAGSSTDDGAQVWQFTSNGAANQKWAAERQADGTYRIVAAHSGKVLDVAEYSKDNGGRIHQWTWHGGPNQRWRIEPIDDDLRIVNVNSGKVLDVADFSRADGGRIHQWDWHGGVNQRWKGLLTNVAAMQPDPGRVITSVNSGRVLDVSEISVNNGAQVWQWQTTGGLNQRWYVEPLGDGTFRFVALHSGHVLDVSASSTADGAKVQQWEWNGGANQRWRIDNLLDGSARVTNVNSGKVLDVAEFSKDNGGIVHQWTWHGGPNQRWRGLV